MWQRATWSLCALLSAAWARRGPAACERGAGTPPTAGSRQSLQQLLTDELDTSAPNTVLRTPHLEATRQARYTVAFWWRYNASCEAQESNILYLGAPSQAWQFQPYTFSASLLPGGHVEVTHYTTARFHWSSHWLGLTDSSAASGIPERTWTHLAFVVNVTTLTYYKNGVVDSVIKLRLETGDKTDFAFDNGAAALRASAAFGYTDCPLQSSMRALYWANDALSGDSIRSLAGSTS